MGQEKPAKKCPSCGLISPPEAERCDCGWDFAARSQKQSYLPRGRTTATATAAAGVGGLVILAYLAHFALMLMKMWSETGH